MKLNKISMKKLLIIILSVFVLVPIVLMLLGYDRTISEGFFNMADNDVTLKNPSITGLVAPVAGSNAGEISNNSYDVSSGNLYCINGNITCANGYDVSLVSTGTDGIDIFQCISGATIDNTQASCNSSIYSGGSSYKGLFKTDENNCRVLDSANTEYQLKSFKGTYMNSSQYNISGDLDEFTGAYTSVPLKFTTDGSYDYVILQNVINDTSWSDISLSSCFLFKTQTECTQTIGGCQDTQTQSGTGSSSSSNKLDTKCLGDFGDTTGDKLCCGQTGVIQSEHAKYTCPESHPYCRNYKCGDSWGSCYKGDD